MVLFSMFESQLINSGCFGGGGYDDRGLVNFFFLLIGITGVLIYNRSSLFRVILTIVIAGFILNILLNFYYHPYDEVFISIYLPIAGALFFILKDRDLKHIIS